MKNSNTKKYKPFISSLDTNRFGFRTARVSEMKGSAVEDILTYCREEKVELLITRCISSDYSTVHSLERNDFLLMGTLVYYRFELDKLPQEYTISTGSFKIRKAALDDADKVKSIARRAFSGFQGHYHSDSRLPSDKCDQVYISWAHDSVKNNELADIVLIAEKSSRITGFLTLKRRSKSELEGRLLAVDPMFQKQGVAQLLMNKAKKWGQSINSDIIVISTQITNFPPQKTWVKAGFKPYKTYYTFHKWFDV